MFMSVVRIDAEKRNKSLLFFFLEKRHLTIISLLRKVYVIVRTLASKMGILVAVDPGPSIVGWV